MKPVKILLLLLPGLLAGCGGPNFSQLEKGSLRVAEGEVDNVVRSEIPYEKKMLSLTSVGFNNGEGITLVGIQPGVSKGKQVRVTAEYIGNINGTDVFTVKQISAVKAPEAEVTPAPAAVITPASVPTSVPAPVPVVPAAETSQAPAASASSPN